MTGNVPAFVGSSSAESYWTGALNPRFSLLKESFPASDTHKLTVAQNDQLRSAVDGELAALQSINRSINHFRNSLALICQIPPEILCRIFSWCAAMDRPRLVSNRNRHSVSFKPGWLNATYVCQHWRDTASQEPTLWQEIMVHLGPNWLRESLARSKAAPVSMFWKPGPGYSLNPIPEHLSHTASLTLAGSISDLSPLLRSLTSPGPMLEKFQLSVMGKDPVPDSFAMSLPDDFLGYHAPRLRSVELQGCLIPLTSPTSPVFSQVAQIKMVARLQSIGYPQRQLSLPAASQLLVMLEDMPALEDLNLIHSLSLTCSNVVEAALPALSCLALTDAIDECNLFLRHVHMTSLSRLYLTCVYDASASLADACLTIRDSLHKHWATIESHEPFRTLLLCEQSEHVVHTLRFEGWRAILADVDMPPFDFCFSFSPLRNIHREAAQQLASPPLPSDAMSNLCRGLPPFYQVHFIRIECGRQDAFYARWSKQTWMDLFGRSQQVEVISVSGSLVISSLLEALHPETPAETSDEYPETVLFPKLNKIFLIQVQLSPCRMPNGEAFDLFTALVGWLNAAARRRTLPTIQIMDSNVTREEVMTLSHLTDVAWDEKAGTADNSWIALG